MFNQAAQSGISARNHATLSAVCTMAERLDWQRAYLDDMSKYDSAVCVPQVEDGETITAVYPSDASFWSELVSHHSKWIRSY